MSHHGGGHGHHGHHGGGGFHGIFLMVAAIIITVVVVTYALQASLILGAFAVAGSWWLFRSLACCLVLLVGFCMRPGEVRDITRRAIARRRQKPPFVHNASARFTHRKAGRGHRH